jgi:hypothetical protein
MVKTARRNSSSTKQRRTRRRQSKSRKQSIKQLRERRQRRQSQKPRSQRRTRRRKRNLRGGDQDEEFSQHNLTQLKSRTGEKGLSLKKAFEKLRHKSSTISPETAPAISPETDTAAAAAQPVSNRVNISEDTFIDSKTRKEMSGIPVIAFPVDLQKLTVQSLHTKANNAEGVYESGGKIFKFFKNPNPRCAFTPEMFENLIGTANKTLSKYVIEYLNYGIVTIIERDEFLDIDAPDEYFYIIMDKGTVMTHVNLTTDDLLKIFQNIDEMNSKGFSHGDIKLDNIVKIGEGEREEIKFIDYEDTLQYPGCSDEGACRDVISGGLSCPKGMFQIGEDHKQILTIDRQAAFLIYLFKKLLKTKIISNMEEFVGYTIPYFKRRLGLGKRYEGAEEEDADLTTDFELFKSLNNANFLEKMTAKINEDQ